MAWCLCLLAQAAPAWAAIMVSPVAGRWGTNGRVWSIVRGNVAYLGGEFTEMIPSDPARAPVPVQGLAAVNVYTGRLTTWAPKVDGDVQSVAFEGDEVVVAGHFGFIAGQNFPKLSAFDLAGNLDTTWRPRPNSAKGVWTVAASPDTLFVGGDFTMVGNASFERFAEFPVS